MQLYDAQLRLREAAREGLDALSIDNLKCGRITRQCMALMFKRWEFLDGYSREKPFKDMYFADWLNDLLEAGRVVWAAERVKVCADAMNDNAENQRKVESMRGISTSTRETPRP